MATHSELLVVLKRDPDMEGKNTVDVYGHDCSWGCKFFHELDGDRGMDWGVCTQPKSHRAGLLTFEHMGCEHYEPEEE